MEALPIDCTNYALEDDVGGYREDNNGNRRQMITKTMLLKYTARCVLSKHEERRLKLWPLCPTTIDNPEEHIGNLISPIVRSTRSLSYWSSGGSDVSVLEITLHFGGSTLLPCDSNIHVRTYGLWIFDAGRE